jgi:hypothetical protein
VKFRPPAPIDGNLLLEAYDAADRLERPVPAVTLRLAFHLIRTFNGSGQVS